MKRTNVHILRNMLCVLLIAVMIVVSFLNIRVYADNVDFGGKDWVKLVSVTPNHYENYTDSVTFTATIDYSLQSREEGIIYLGFNTQDVHRFVVDTSESARVVVSKGEGRVVLSETVTPVNWNTSVSFMEQFSAGYSDLVKDFKIYANISEHPHDVPWVPLAADEAVLTELPEYADDFGSGDSTIDAPVLDDTTLAIQKRTFAFSDPTTVDAYWGWNYILNGNPSQYNNEMATVALALSAAAERGQSDIESILGGDNFKADHIKSINYGEANAIDHPAGTFAHRTIKNGGVTEHIIIIAARGTSSIEDFMTDAYSVTDHFSEPASNLWRSYLGWLNTSGLAEKVNAANTKFFVTGHSLGGAVANRIAYRLTSDYGNGNVFAYTFASPPTEGHNSTWLPNILNVLCAGDPVPYAGTFTDGRYGAELWFQNSCKFPIHIFDLFANHVVESYMKHLLRKDGFRAVRASAQVCCPVDIKIYDSSGRLAGSVTDNTIDKENMTDSVAIVLSGDNHDEKNIYFIKDDTYTIDFTGTDLGTLTYTVRNTYVGQRTIVEKVYENVGLYDGKQMTSTIDANSDTSISQGSGAALSGGLSDIRLYVLDENGDIRSEVQTDGKGTEVDIKKSNDESPENTDIKVSKIKISGISKKIALEKKISLKASVFPSNAANKAVTWKSGNKKYAIVDSRGVVTIKKKGKGKTVTIIAEAKDGSGVTASYKIKCMEGVVKKISVVGKSIRTVKAGSSFKVKTKVTASKGANKTLKWKSSNTKYATVSSHGVVKVKKKGKGKTVRIVVQATDGSGKKAVIQLKIRS